LWIRPFALAALVAFVVAVLGAFSGCNADRAVAAIESAALEAGGAFHRMHVAADSSTALMERAGQAMPTLEATALSIQTAAECSTDTFENVARLAGDVRYATGHVEMESVYAAKAVQSAADRAKAAAEDASAMFKSGSEVWSEATDLFSMMTDAATTAISAFVAIRDAAASASTAIAAAQGAAAQNEDAIWTNTACIVESNEIIASNTVEVRANTSLLTETGISFSLAGGLLALIYFLAQWSWHLLDSLDASRGEQRRRDPMFVLQAYLLATTAACAIGGAFFASRYIWGTEWSVTKVPWPGWIGVFSAIVGCIPLFGVFVLSLCSFGQAAGRRQVNSRWRFIERINWLWIQSWIGSLAVVLLVVTGTWGVVHTVYAAKNKSDSDLELAVRLLFVLAFAIIGLGSFWVVRRDDEMIVRGFLHELPVRGPRIPRGP
jgi:hypothetical protein